MRRRGSSLAAASGRGDRSAPTRHALGGPAPQDLADPRLAAGVNLGVGLFVVGLALAGVLIFYLMLIFAPRQVAEREGSPSSWVVRFLVFVASLAIGQTWLGFVRG